MAMIQTWKILNKSTGHIHECPTFAELQKECLDYIEQGIDGYYNILYYEDYNLEETDEIKTYFDL